MDDDVQNVVKQLGKPDSADAAMGNALMVWYLHHNTAGYKTAIFTHHNMGGKDEAIARIQKILITSPAFKTVERLSVGSAKAAIEKAYTLKPTSTYTNNNKKVVVYTDLKKGISFEISSESNTCTGIIVHKANDSAAAYLNMH